MPASELRAHRLAIQAVLACAVALVGGSAIVVVAGRWLQG